MLRNYLMVAIRNLLREKVYAFINIAGLAIGIACTLLLTLFVHHEWSFDRFHEKSDRLFRVNQQLRSPRGYSRTYGLTHEALAAAAKENVPGVVRSTRLVRSHALVGFEGRQAARKTFLLVDPDFFQMFTVKFLSGDPTTALAGLKNVVLALETARDLLGDREMDPAVMLGRSVTFGHDDGPDVYTVSAIVESWPSTSSRSFDLIVRHENLAGYGHSRYNEWFTETYVELADRDIYDRAAETLASHAMTVCQEAVGQMRAKNRIGEGEDALVYHLQKLVDIRHGEGISGGYAKKGNATTMWVLASLGAVVLLLSCINFTTLALSRSVKRATEVGMRKVMGARRVHLVCQFCGEGVVTATLALAAALGLTELALPSFNALALKELSLVDLGFVKVMGFGVLLVLLVGVAGGAYPAFSLSRLQPTSVLKGQGRATAQPGIIAVMLALQYAVSIGMIVCTIVILRQLNYVHSKDLGYTTDPLLRVNMHRSAGRELRAERFHSALLQESRIVSASLIGSSNHNVKNRAWEATVRFNKVDEHYLSTMGVDLVTGRPFDLERSSDKRDAIVVNERFVKAMGLEVGDALEKYSWGDPPTIIGVFKDYHYQSLHYELGPVVLHMNPSVDSDAVLVRLRRDDVGVSVEKLKQIWHEVAGDLPFDFKFVDEEVQRGYRQDERWGQIVGLSATIAILIACMGIYGQAALSISRRAKEIGVRKVVGATARNIVVLLSQDIVKLALVANLIAWPAAYYVSRLWLGNFAYRIDLTPDLFALGGLTAFGIAVVTVGWLGLRAANEDPVRALRYE